jgi:heme/copper-type cytochrome/quinol oxidase subunit 2
MSGRRLKHPVKLLIILSLACIITLPVFTSHLVAAQTTSDSTQYYNKTFTWDYKGNHWTWNLSIPKVLYDAYKEVPDYTRTRNGPAGYGYLTTTEDYYIGVLAEKLNETTNSLHYNSFDKVSFILAFVQSLPYSSDNVTTRYDEYPRFPIETLIDDGGDCEDTSILFATITLILGYGTIYINPSGHYAVGVLGNNLQGSYWTYQNKTYYYCETTGNGFTIGQLPDDFANAKANLYPIDQTRQFVAQVTYDPTDQATPAPTDAQSIWTTQPTSTPNPTDNTLPIVPGPTKQEATPLSFNLISQAPVLFAVILFAVIASFAVAVWSVRKRGISSQLQSQIVESTTPETPGAINKFCIYCGSSNKNIAVYCETCGKQISEA